MNKVLFVGEINVGPKGCVHQQDFAAALGAERITSIPKDGEVPVVVGRLLKDRKPALLIQAEKRGLPISKVEDVMTPEVGRRIVELLKAKPRRETYEVVALEFLIGTGGSDRKPKREKSRRQLG